MAHFQSTVNLYTGGSDVMFLAKSSMAVTQLVNKTHMHGPSFFFWLFVSSFLVKFLAILYLLIKQEFFGAFPH